MEGGRKREKKESKLTESQISKKNTTTNTKEI